MHPQLSPDYSPSESLEELWEEKTNLNGVALACVAYGILFTVFWQCILAIHSKRHNQRIPWWLVVYLFVIWILATVALASNLRFNEMTFIEYRNYPNGGPGGFSRDFYALPINAFGFATYTVMSWFADGLVLYRYYVIYQRSLTALICPLVLYLGTMASSTGLIVSVVHAGFWEPTAKRFAIAYWSLSVSINVILTTLIAARLFRLRRRIHTTMGEEHTKNYTTIASMLIESAALYSIFAVAFVVMYARDSYLQNIFLPPLGQIQGIAPLLILLRVIQQTAYQPKSERSRPHNRHDRPGHSITTDQRRSAAQGVFTLTNLSQQISIPEFRSTIAPPNSVVTASPSMRSGGYESMIGLSKSQSFVAIAPDLRSESFS